MTELIDRLDNFLARFRPDYYGQLQPGISEQVLDALQVSLRAELPPAFRLLYEWRNGQHPNCSAILVDNWMFNPLEEVRSIKEMLDGMIGTDFEDPGWWSRGWVPFLSNGGGDHLCLDMAAEFGGKPGQLLPFWHDWNNRAVKFDSMETWLQSTLNALLSKG